MSINNFGVDELLYHPEIYDKTNSFTYDIPFYIELAQQFKGDVLELCCGNGRITIPMAEKGIKITGLDFTPRMIEDARKKSKIKNIDIEFLVGDMRKFELDKKFDFIFIPFNSLQNTYLLDDIESVFNCVKRHLNKDGLFVVNVFNPNFKYLLSDGLERKPIFEFNLSDGQHVRVDQAMKYNALMQINQVKWYYKIGDQEEKIQRVDMRCFFPQEIDGYLKFNGFDIINKYGDFSKNVFTGTEPSQVILCKLK